MASVIEFAISFTFLIITFLILSSYVFSKSIEIEKNLKEKYFLLKTLNYLSNLNLRELIRENKLESFLKDYGYEVKVCINSCDEIPKEYKFVISYFISGVNDVDPKILLIYVIE